MNIINNILENLKLVSFGLVLFVVAYITNMLFSTYYNIQFLKEKFEINKLKESAIKILMFIFGTAFLCIGITTVPIFAEYAGLVLPREFIDAFQQLAIVSVFVVMACRYFIEAFAKFKIILGYDKPDNEDEEEKDIKIGFEKDIDSNIEIKEETMRKKK